MVIVVLGLFVFFLNKLTFKTLCGRSVAEARLSLANEIYKEKIRADYPPTLLPSASLSHSL